MQKTISLKNIEYSIQEKHILRGVSFRCDPTERLCLFGENGAGKSTLLKILSGDLDADEGVIHKEGYIRFVYVSQEFDARHSQMTIKEYIESYAGAQYFKKVYTLGNKLGFDLEKNNEKQCDNISGGQQKILALSVAFAINPDYLLLDEPENHLDIVSRMILIEMLKEYKGGIIFISHDRLIIDSIATKIGELVKGELYLSEGDYDDYVQAKMERLGGLQRAYDKETKRINQLTKSLVILQQKAFRGKDVAQYKQAKAELEELKLSHRTNKRPIDNKTQIKLSAHANVLHSGKLLLKIVSGSFGYADGDLIFKNTDLEIRSGLKIALLGRNGSGKSTFLKCLMGEEKLVHGEITIADGIQVSYFDQHMEFSPDASSLDVIGEKLHCIENDARMALGAIKFDREKMESPIKNLSGGEKMRLRFAITFGLNPDVLILDEPTNHIDEITWEILLETCKSFKGTILLVSHDYEFIENFSPSVFFMMQNKTIKERYKDLDILLEEMRVE